VVQYRSGTVGTGGIVYCYNDVPSAPTVAYHIYYYYYY
jgi:hypothetical protein